MAMDWDSDEVNEAIAADFNDGGPPDALAEMIADTERMGLYDEDLAEVTVALKAARKKTGR